MQYPHIRGVIGIGIVGVIFGVTVTAVVAAAGSKITVDGSATTVDVQMIAGRPYVPLSEIAKVFGRNVQKTADGYTLMVPGGANAVDGLRGSIGDTLFDGKWRFKVIDVTRADTYTLNGEGGLDYAKYNSVAESADSKSFTAKPGNEFVLVHCQIKNGQKTSQAFGSSYGTNTALADDKGSSYRPVGFQQEGGMILTKELLPGAAQDLTAVFVVPKTARITSLVFTLTNVSDKNPADVRITLTPSNKMR